ncbi:MAG TPA: hypothetical protein VGM59_15865 [Dongiaceae bacterium]
MTDPTPKRTAKTLPETPATPAIAAKTTPVGPAPAGGAKPAKAFKPVIIFTNDKV